MKKLPTERQWIAILELQTSLQIVRMMGFDDVAKSYERELLRLCTECGLITPSEEKKAA